jgi:hypothetical protein
MLFQIFNNILKQLHGNFPSFSEKGDLVGTHHKGNSKFRKKYKGAEATLHSFIDSRYFTQVVFPSTVWWGLVLGPVPL